MNNSESWLLYGNNIYNPLNINWNLKKKEIVIENYSLI